MITFAKWEAGMDLIKKYPEKIAIFIVAGNTGDIAIGDIFRAAKAFVCNLPCIVYGTHYADVDLQDTCVPSSYDTDALFEAISLKLPLDSLPQETGDDGNAD